jgi:hypothetical protein
MGSGSRDSWVDDHEARIREAEGGHDKGSSAEIVRRLELYSVMKERITRLLDLVENASSDVKWAKKKKASCAKDMPHVTCRLFASSRSQFCATTNVSRTRVQSKVVDVEGVIGGTEGEICGRRKDEEWMLLIMGR